MYKMGVRLQLRRMKKAVVVQSAARWRYVDDGRTLIRHTQNQLILTNFILKIFFIFFFPYFIQNIS